MNAPSDDAGRLAFLLSELRMPTIARLWPEPALRNNKEGWPGTRFLGALLEHDSPNGRNGVLSALATNRISIQPRLWRALFRRRVDALEVPCEGAVEQ